MSAQDEANQAALEFACHSASQLALLADPEAPITVPPYSSPPGTSLFYNGPQSCIAACPDGTTTGFTTPPGRFSGANQAQADAYAANYACQQAYFNRLCLTDLAGHCCANSSATFQISAFGGSGAVTWSIVSGGLPLGMHVTIASRTLTISGTPTTPGDYSFSYTVTDAAGHTRTKAFTITVLGITNDFSLPDATNGDPYSVQLTVSGGTAPYTFALESGALADGLSIAADGLISGTPNVAIEADYPFTASVQDSTGLKCNKALNIHVSACSGVPNDISWTIFASGPTPPFGPVQGDFSGSMDQPTQTGTCSGYATSGIGFATQTFCQFISDPWAGPYPDCDIKITISWHFVGSGPDATMEIFGPLTHITRSFTNSDSTTITVPSNLFAASQTIQFWVECPNGSVVADGTLSGTLTLEFV